MGRKYSEEERGKRRGGEVQRTELLAEIKRRQSEARQSQADVEILQQAIVRPRQTFKRFSTSPQ